MRDASFRVAAVAAEAARARSARKPAFETIARRIEAMGSSAASETMKIQTRHHDCQVKRSARRSRAGTERRSRNPRRAAALGESPAPVAPPRATSLALNQRPLRARPRFPCCSTERDPQSRWPYSPRSTCDHPACSNGRLDFLVTIRLLNPMTHARCSARKGESDRSLVAERDVTEEFEAVGHERWRGVGGALCWLRQTRRRR